MVQWCLGFGLPMTERYTSVHMTPQQAAVSTIKVLSFYIYTFPYTTWFKIR